MEPWTFVHITDIHIGSPRSFRFEPRFNENFRAAREQIAALRPDLVLVGGDLTRDGFLHDYEMDAAKAELDAMGLPYHCVPGNMEGGNKFTPRRGPREDHDDLADNVSSEWLGRYKRWFGDYPWTFVHKNVRFTGYDPAVAGSGLPDERKMWDFLARLEGLPRAEHHVVLTHYPLFLDRIDEPTYDITDPAQYTPWYAAIDEPHRGRILELMKRAGVTVALSGHLHHYRQSLAEGILFIKGPATARPQWRDHWKNPGAGVGFLWFEVGGRSLNCQLMPLPTVSTTKGYGPVGHPLPHLRDYSLAWEK